MPLNLALALRMSALGSVAASPTAFLGTDLIAWWTADASNKITLSGSQVTSWKDMVAAYDAVQGVSGSRPLYSATSFNGQPGITFDGTDDELTCTDAALLAVLPAGATPCEIWSIVQQDAPAGSATLRSSLSYGENVSANAARRTSRNVTGGVNRAAMSCGTGAATPSLLDTVVDFSSRHVVRYVFTATGMRISVDGNALSSETAAVGATVVERLRHGASAVSTAAGFWLGKSRDQVITKPLSTAKAAQMTQWGLARRML